LRGAGLPALVERGEVFGLDLGLVMGSSEVRAAPSATPPQPCPALRPAGQDPEAGPKAAPSQHSNAPIRPERQSILSKIVARTREMDNLDALKS
jgi:hypothetical protein